MPRPAADLLTEREAQLMDVIWTLGEGTADQIRQNLAEELHDSTVRTQLRILESKGYVSHMTRGKSYVYRPSVPRVEAQRSAVRSFLSRLFSGSAEDLVLRLLEEEVLTPQQLAEIQQSIRPRRSRRPSGGST